jgi:hypothetical protein
MPVHEPHDLFLHRSNAAAEGETINPTQAIMYAGRSTASADSSRYRNPPAPMIRTKFAHVTVLCRQDGDAASSSTRLCVTHRSP